VVSPRLKLPFVSSSVIDVIISALRSGGYLASDASADAIRLAPGNLDTTARDALAASLSYGSSGGGGPAIDKLTGTGDVYCLVDSDNTNPTSPYTNFFIVAKGIANSPVLDSRKILMTVSSETDNAVPDLTPVYLTVGPRDRGLAPASADYPVTLELGGRNIFLGGFSSSFYHHGVLTAGKEAVYTGHSGSVQGLRIQSSGFLSIIQGMDSTLMGIDAFYNDAPIVFHRWDQNYLHGLGFQQTGTNEFRLYPMIGDAAQHPVVFLSGSGAAGTNFQFCIAGAPDVAGLDPRDLPIRAGESGVRHAACLIVGATPVAGFANEVRSGLYVNHLDDNATLAASTDRPRLVIFDSAYDTTGAVVPQFNLFSITCRTTGVSSPVFTVDSNRKAYIDQGIVTGHGADVAEAVAVVGQVQDYPPGTVLVLRQDSLAEKSSSIANPAVLGVVSTAPGLTLGSYCRETSPRAFDDRTPQVLLALCGTVPVNGSTLCGSIEVGFLLVSGPDGTAVWGGYHPGVGTVVGKALQALIQPEGTDTPVLGEIKMLAMIQ
jgi:hypothetical protein